MIAPVIVAAGIAAAGSVASSFIGGKKKGGDVMPPVDASTTLIGGAKTIYFSGSLGDQLQVLGIGAAVVVIIAWLKRAKDKK